MGRWIHKGGKSRPDKRFKNVLAAKIEKIFADFKFLSPKLKRVNGAKIEFLVLASEFIIFKFRMFFSQSGSNQKSLEN